MIYIFMYIFGYMQTNQHMFMSPPLFMYTGTNRLIYIVLYAFMPFSRYQGHSRAWRCLTPNCRPWGGCHVEVSSGWYTQTMWPSALRSDFSVSASVYCTRWSVYCSGWSDVSTNIYFPYRPSICLSVICTLPAVAYPKLLSGVIQVSLGLLLTCSSFIVAKGSSEQLTTVSWVLLTTGLLQWFYKPLFLIENISTALTSWDVRKRIAQNPCCNFQHCISPTLLPNTLPARVLEVTIHVAVRK